MSSMAAEADVMADMYMPGKQSGKCATCGVNVGEDKKVCGGCRMATYCSPVRRGSGKAGGGGNVAAAGVPAGALEARWAQGGVCA